MHTTSTIPTYAAIAAYERQGHAPSPRQFTNFMRKASAEHLATKRRPQRRMAGPGGLHRNGTDPDGRNTVPVWSTPEGLMMSMPGDDLPPVRVSAEGIRTVLDSPRYLLMPLSPRIAAALETVIERSGELDDRRTAHQVGVLRRMTASSKMLVLSTALGRTFWTPAGQDESNITAWSRALGTQDGPAGWRDLAGHALLPAFDYDTRYVNEHGVVQVRGYNKQIREAEDEVCQSDTLRKLSTSAAVAGYSMCTAVDGLFAAICRTDPLLIPYYLLTGEVVAMTARRFEGSLLVGELSTPSKLRSGKDMLVIMGDRISDVHLDSLGYDEDRDVLLGAVAQTKTARRADAKRGRSSGVDEAGLLFDMGRYDGVIYLTDRPFSPRQTASPAKWSSASTESLPPLAPMNMPLDVAVAGAPVGD